MSTRPPISVRRPARPTDPAPSATMPIAHSPIPNIDPDAAEAVAFSMRGRLTAPEGDAAGRKSAAPEPPAAELPHPDEGLRYPTPTQTTRDGDPSQLPAKLTGEEPDSAVREHALAADWISVKLPPEVGRQLAAIADRRGSKRTLVAIEALSEPLRSLAAAHRAGAFPELPKVVSGTVRSSIAFALPPNLSADLDYVLRVRRAVRAQVVTRLLAPAIGALFDLEVAGRSK
jgi:hypothetical protein